MANSNPSTAGALASVLILLKQIIDSDNDVHMAIYNMALPELLPLIKQHQI